MVVLWILKWPLMLIDLSYSGAFSFKATGNNTLQIVLWMSE